MLLASEVRHVNNSREYSHHSTAFYTEHKEKRGENLFLLLSNIPLKNMRPGLILRVSTNIVSTAEIMQV
jgi:hypothetical protein